VIRRLLRDLGYLGWDLCLTVAVYLGLWLVARGIQACLALVPH
jgi:hypothetical protein